MTQAIFSAPRGRSRLPLLLLLAAIVIAVWGVASRLQARSVLREQATAAAVLQVLTVSPDRQNSTAPLVLPATVEAWAEASIFARTNGYLKRWLVDIGAPVKAGQVLAEIDTPEIDAQLRQARADLATVRANLDLASSTAARYRNLIAQHLVSQQDADTKFAAEAVAKAALLSAEANMARLQQLSDFKRVLSPFDGVVTARNTDVGALIGAGSGVALFRVADLHQLRLYVQVPQAYAAGIQPGQIAEFSMADQPGRVFKATVSNTANTLDASNRSLRTQLSVDNPQGELLAGGYAEVRLPIAERGPGAAATLRVPANALLFRAEGLQLVTVGSDGLAHLKNVRISRDLGATVEIAEGLDPNDQVVVNPPDSIAEGLAVKASPMKIAAGKS